MIDHDRLAEYIVESIENFRDSDALTIGNFDGSEEMLAMMDENTMEFFDAVQEIARRIHVTYQGEDDE